MTEDRPQVPSNIDISAALANPSAYFAQPRDVLAYPGMSNVLKLKLLHQWDHDARLLAEAEGEGMGGGEESMLGRVRQTLRQLEASMDTMESSAVASGVEEPGTEAQHAAARTPERTSSFGRSCARDRSRAHCLCLRSVTWSAGSRAESGSGAPSRRTLRLGKGPRRSLYWRGSAPSRCAVARDRY
jgi:hypothetical protein